MGAGKTGISWEFARCRRRSCGADGLQPGDNGGESICQGRSPGSGVAFADASVRELGVSEFVDNDLYSNFEGRAPTNQRVCAGS